MVDPADILKAPILVVDDATVNVLLFEHMLSGAGYSAVTTTTDPTAVCALHRAHRYDLILLDLLMPGMDGFQVMQGLQEVETEGYIPVLVLSAQPDHKLRALQAGAKDFISKPFDRIEVLTRIHNMLEVRLLLRESRNYGRLLERYDPLTGLANRTFFRQRLARAQARSAESREIVSVIVVALDRFKHVNDALGRDVGDGVLRGVADRLAGCIGAQDTAARLEGDQFALLVVTPAGDPHGAQRAADAVRDSLRPAFDTDGHSVSVTASIGIAVSPTDTAEPDALLKYADEACHEAKDAGRDTCRFFWPDTGIGRPPAA